MIEVKYCWSNIIQKKNSVLPENFFNLHLNSHVNHVIPRKEITLYLEKKYLSYCFAHPFWIFAAVPLLSWPLTHSVDDEWAKDAESKPAEGIYTHEEEEVYFQRGRQIFLARRKNAFIRDPRQTSLYARAIGTKIRTYNSHCNIHFFWF